MPPFHTESKSATMQNIMFSGDNPQKILDGTKDLTARCWKREPPRVGQLMTASTGYAKETRFAIIRIIGVWEWNGKMNGKNAESVTGLTRNEIAKREGFGDTPRPKDSWLTDWDAFIEAYYGLNAQKFLDDDRRHYFIAFEVIQRQDEKTKCNGCEQEFEKDKLNWTYSNSPICDDCLLERHYRRSRSPRA